MKRILWTVNLIPKNLASEMKLDCTVLGGWVEAMSAQVSRHKDFKLAIACKCDEAEPFSYDIADILYYSLNYTKKDAYENLKNRCREIINDFKPDLIHIEGTEFIHAKAMSEIAKETGIKTVISAQGILNGQYNYQCGQLQIDDMMFSRSLTNIYAAWILHLRKTRWYKPRMKPERELLETAEYFLGRTTWDRAHLYKINPNAKYFSCNRVLREPFYKAKWNINSMQRHSIYVGNGYFALKGLHFVLEAMPQLIREYPDLKLYVAGYEPVPENDKRGFLKKGYSAYLKKLIDDNNLKDYIEFTGPLNAEQVAEKLSKVNVYVLASAAENSPNTLGEAMLVGTPCVASYVGGVPDMALDGKDALFYRNDDTALMAWNIKKVFDNDGLALSLSDNAQKHAAVTHDSEINYRQLVDAYTQILNS